MAGQEQIPWALPLGFCGEMPIGRTDQSPRIGAEWESRAGPREAPIGLAAGKHPSLLPWEWRGPSPAPEQAPEAKNP